MSIKEMIPEEYNKYCTLQHINNKLFLDKNIRRIVWKGNDRVLDVGSGDGSFTSNVLRRYLPDDIDMLVGCDISEEMVKFANKHYERDRTKFKVLEMGKTLPAEFLGSFDHIFSFFTLHRIRDARLAISQVYDILSDGGDCLLNIVAKFPAFADVYRGMIKSKKWSRWVKNLDEVVSPYHDCIDPDIKLRKIAEDVGFKNIFVECVKSTYTYASIEHYRGIVRSINPFHIPEDLMEDYLEEFVKLAKHEGYLSDNHTVNYSTNTFYGRK